MYRSTKFWLGLIGIVLLLGILWYLRTILYYIMIAAVLSFIGRPLVEWMQRLRIRGKPIPNAVAAFIVLLIYMAAIVGFISLFVPLVAEEIRILSSVRVEDVVKSLRDPIEQIEAWMEKSGLAPPEGVDLVSRIRDQLAGALHVRDLPSLITAFFGKLGGIFITFFSIFFITFFFLKEEKLLYTMVLSVTPSGHVEKMENVLRNTKRLLSRYFIGILIQVIVITTIVSVGLSLIGIDNAVVIGFMAGIMNIVPYLGPLIGAGIGITVGITTNLQLSFYSEMVPMIGQILLVFVIVQMVDNFLLQPLIYSTSAKAHPLEVFLVVLVGATLAGILGMILAIPAYTFIRIVAKEFLYEFRIVKRLTKGL
ncbi:MAG: AI-2E family transporter [Flavobacteriales bacterium]